MAKLGKMEPGTSITATFAEMRLKMERTSLRPSSQSTRKHGIKRSSVALYARLTLR